MVIFLEFWLPLIVWIFGFGFISIKTKASIADWFIKNSKLPQYLNFFLLASPLIIFEELLTCRPVISLECLPTTFPSFHIMLGGLYIFWRLTKLSYLKTALLFGIFGAFNEMIILGKHFILPIHISILFWILVIPIYSLISLIPLYYLERSSFDILSPHVQN